jgi:hypothetical protein
MAASRVFWVVSHCSLVEAYRLTPRPDDEGSKHL